MSTPSNLRVIPKCLKCKSAMIILPTLTDSLKCRCAKCGAVFFFDDDDNATASLTPTMQQALNLEEI